MIKRYKFIVFSIIIIIYIAFKYVDMGCIQCLSDKKTEVSKQQNFYLQDIQIQEEAKFKEALLEAKKVPSTRWTKLLNAIAREYFDEEYYLKTYPELARLRESLFEHYSILGWKEGKNPSKNFDNNFYKRMYEAWDRNMRGLNPLQDSIKCKFLLKICYSNPNQIKKVQLLAKPKYYLALAALFRDDARFLKEWIEFYRLMGVEHFYLYNHLSKDDYMSVLKPYIESGLVELKNIDTENANATLWRIMQLKIYDEIIQNTKDDVEWLLMIDSDEFIFPTKEDNLVSVLKKYDNYASLSVNTRFFGSGNVDKIAKNKLLIESLTMAEKLDTTDGAKANVKPILIERLAKTEKIGTVSIVKTIVKPRYVENYTNPHFPVLKPGYAQVTENYEYFYGPFTPYHSMNIIRGNHYWARDWENFIEYKVSRVHILENPTLVLDKKTIEDKINQLYKVNKERSSVFDNSIERFVEPLRSRVF